MRRFIFLICAQAFLAGMATAGPWPRTQGTTFVSLSSSASTPYGAVGQDLQVFHSFFLEYGLPRELTFGLDAGADPDWRYGAIGFLRTPVMKTDSPHLFAAQVGLGTRFDGSANETLLQLGASWGRGFDTEIGGGWATLDTQVQLLLDTGNSIAKADLTIGVKPADHWKVMLQVQSSQYPGAKPVLRLAPSVAYSVGEGRHLEVGAQFGVVNEARFGLKIGSWVEF